MDIKQAHYLPSAVLHHVLPPRKSSLVNLHQANTNVASSGLESKASKANIIEAPASVGTSSNDLNRSNFQNNFYRQSLDNLRRGLRSQGGLAGRSRPQLQKSRSKGNTALRGIGPENLCETEQARRQRFTENMELIGKLVAKSQSGFKSRRTTIALNTDKTVADLEGSKGDDKSLGGKVSHALMSPKVVQPTFKSTNGINGASIKSPVATDTFSGLEMTQQEQLQVKMI